MPVLIPKAGCMQAIVVGDYRHAIAGQHDVEFQQFHAGRQYKIEAFEAVLWQDSTRTPVASDPDGIDRTAKGIQLAKLSDQFSLRLVVGSKRCRFSAATLKRRSVWLRTPATISRGTPALPTINVVAGLRKSCDVTSVPARALMAARPCPDAGERKKGVAHLEALPLCSSGPCEWNRSET